MNLTFRLIGKIVKCRRQVRALSTVAEQVYVQDESVPNFRTTESNPVNHKLEHLHKIYTIPEEDLAAAFNQLTPDYREQNKTFCELGLLIRKPALEIMSYLKNADYSRPVNRYVLYGEFGTGKSSTLMHVLHYGYMLNRIIVHVPWAPHWYCWPKEKNPLANNPEMTDLPIDAGSWLLYFRNMNQKSLSLTNLTTTKRYEWSYREITEEGTPLEEMINFGINRVKFATEIIAVLIDELKRASIEGKCHTLVVVDGYNSFWGDHTNIKDTVKNEFRHPDQITITKPFKEITKFDWCNGAVVLSVDKFADKVKRDSCHPRYLLDKKGFEHLDPFVPIEIENYNDEEYDAIIEYFRDRKWIGSVSRDAIEELRVVSNKNPHTVMQYFRHVW